MANLTKEQAINIIQRRKMVASDVNGAYVTCSVFHVSDILTDKEGKQYRIVNLGLMNEYYLGQAKKALAEGELSKATNQHYSRNIPADADWCPVAGEKVKVFVQETTTSNDITGQFITQMLPVGTASTSNVDLGLEDEVAEATAEEVLGKDKK